jgi:hypothetical protein
MTELPREIVDGAGVADDLLYGLLAADLGAPTRRC